MGVYGGARPYLIGLVGPIGAGKTRVARTLARWGADVFDADRAVARLYTPGSRMHRQVVAAFGPGILSPDGRIDRRRLGARVFDDPTALRRLEGIVHPWVRKAVRRWLERAARRGRPVAVLEAIKLLESPLRTLCQEIWMVDAPPQVRFRRLLQRGMDPASARQRIAAQEALAARMAAEADWILDNGGDWAETEARLRERWQALLARLGVPIDP